MNVTLVLLVLASIAYAVGGLFMKQSQGLTHALPTAIFLALFCAGAILQALGMRQDHMGSAYILVLGVEAVAALALSAAVLHEPYSPSKLAAVAVVVLGIAWLRHA